jgi:hypothetical protein
MRQRLAQATAADQHGGSTHLSGWKPELSAIGERVELDPRTQRAELGARYGIGHELDGRHGADGTS